MHQSTIDGLQSIPRGSNDKDMAARLVELTIEANEKPFVIVFQHGGNTYHAKQCITYQLSKVGFFNKFLVSSVNSVLLNGRDHGTVKMLII